MKSTVKAGLAATASVALVFGLVACGNSPSEPTPNQGSESSPAATSPTNSNPDSLGIPAPQDSGTTYGLALSISGTEQTAIGDRQITVSGGTVSIGIGGPANIVGDKVVLTTTRDKVTRVLSEGQQEMKDASGASYAMFNLNNVDRTGTYQIRTIKPANVPDLSTSNVLPNSTPVTGYSRSFTVNYEQN